ncbi:MAG: hypothetical protein U9R44_05805 [Candidatus Omnitrophota bacterium]|nr:hypothetical protein [Candidatus Omnitrophota bacterium]
MKKLLIFFVIFAILSSVSAFASTNKPLQNIGKGLDDIVYGEIEIPDSINETNTKGTPAYPDCTSATNDDVGRGIARFVGGLWKIATFWYPEEEGSVSGK